MTYLLKESFPQKANYQNNLNPDSSLPTVKLVTLLSIAGPVIALHQAALNDELSYELSVSTSNRAMDEWFSSNPGRARELWERQTARSDGQNYPAHRFVWDFLENAFCELDEKVIFDQPVVDMAVSPDGTLMAVAPRQGSIVLVDLSTGGKRRLNPRAKRLAFTSNSVIACGSDNGGVLFWDIESNLPVGNTIDLDTAGVASLVTSPDGNTLCIGLETGEIALCDIASGELNRFPAHESPVRPSAFAPTGNIFASFAEETGKTEIKVWDVPTGECLRSLNVPRGKVRDVSFSEDGRHLVAATGDGIRYWDTKNWLDRTIFPPGVKVMQSVITMSDDIAITGGYYGRIRFWDLESQHHGHTLIGHEDAVWQLLLSPDGDTLYSRTERCIRRWPIEHLRTLKPDWSQIDYSTPLAVAFTSDGKRLLAASAAQPVGSKEDGRLEIWDVATNRLVYEQPAIVTGWHCVAAHPTSDRFATCGPGNVTLCDLSGAGALSACSVNGALIVDEKCRFQCIGYSADGRWLAAAGPLESSDGKLSQLAIWELTGFSAKKQPTIVLTPALSDITCLAFSPDGEHLAIVNSVGWTGQTRLCSWDGSAWNIGEKPIMQDPTRMLACTFSRDGSVLFAGGNSGELRRWDVVMRSELRPLIHAEWMSAAAMSVQGTLATVTAQGIRLWDADTGDELATIPVHGSVPCLAFSPDGKTLAYGNWTRTVRFLRTTGSP